MGKGRAGQHRYRRIGEGLGSDPVKERAALLLDTLGTEDQRLVRSRRRFEHGAHVLRGRDDQPGVAARKLLKLAGRADGLGELQPGQE